MTEQQLKKKKRQELIFADLTRMVILNQINKYSVECVLSNPEASKQVKAAVKILDNSINAFSNSMVAMSKAGGYLLKNALSDDHVHTVSNIIIGLAEVQNLEEIEQYIESKKVK